MGVSVPVAKKIKVGLIIINLDIEIVIKEAERTRVIGMYYIYHLGVVTMLQIVLE